MNLIESLEWRYASKKMNGQEVPREKVDRILRAIQLAPSSMGLQPYTVLVITDPELKTKILPVANNQTQVVDCSHLLVFAAWSSISREQVDEYIDHTAKTRKVPVDTLAGFREALVKMISKNTPEQNFAWAARQVYLAFGTAITAAAVEKVDATPMEGFNSSQLDVLLNLNEQGLRSVILLPLGYRDEEKDWLAKLPKVRRSREKLFIEQ